MGFPVLLRLYFHTETVAGSVNELHQNPAMGYEKKSEYPEQNIFFAKLSEI